jgi:benzoyl-CoA reductase/2-hydroxyglutaryl-CoA dehydratase subunit BcrC/BadD/HgdB
VADYFDIPYFYIDVPPDDFNLETAYRYLVDQLDDCLEWMSKVTGREINDELVIEGVRNEWKSRKLWGQVQEFQKAIPAPLDSRHLQSLLVPGTMVKQKQECVDFYGMLLDEVKHRVDKGISALGIEQSRLLYEWMVPWYYLQIHRYPLKYGAVFIHGTIPAAWAVWDMAADGTWTVADTPEERGLPMRTRRDALRAMAEIYLEKTPGVHWYRTSEGDKAENDVLGRARDWHADAVIFHQDQGCRAAQVGQSEIRMRLQKESIPVMAFEASQCDFRVFSEAEVLDRFDAFLENMGLTSLPGYGHSATQG